MSLKVTAKIEGINYKPTMCRNLKIIPMDQFESALSKSSCFILKIDQTNSIAVSWWVSAKRTRSYPYARVYDTLNFSGKKLTIIPIFKDEGKDGDRDFLQWDTVSLMSLLGVNVIIAYYEHAIKNPKYKNKITSQRFNIDYLKFKINNLLNYQSDALHWNIAQIKNIGEIGDKAINCYKFISSESGVEMHSLKLAKNRINKLKEGLEIFMKFSRKLAKEAQYREMLTEQPKEQLDGVKGIITIENYLGGKYYLTVDEIERKKDDILLIEAKHSKDDKLPSINDIKDGIIKMILFTNLENVSLNDDTLNPIPILKLTTGKPINKTTAQIKIMKNLEVESKINNFNVIINENVSNDYKNPQQSLDFFLNNFKS